jgi:alpha-galactosidase
MMEVGNGFTHAEDRTHFTMWCMLASPLMLGNDIRTMTKETLELITNKELIAVDQDKLGIQGFRYLNDGGFEIWVKPLENDEWAVAFVNMTESARQLSYDWQKHPLQDILAGRYVDFSKSTYTLRDLFAKKVVGDTSKKLERMVEAHDVAVYRIAKKK